MVKRVESRELEILRDGLTRRDTIRLMAGVGAGAALGGLATGCGRARESVPAADPLAGEALYRDVVHYAEMGGHRTGTTVDMATSEWMGGILEEAGFETELVEIPPKRLFELRECSVTVEGVRYPGDPEWFPTATGPTPVTGPLAVLAEGAPMSSLAGKIWVVEDPEEDLRLSRKVQAQAVEAGNAGALAVVAVIHTYSGELLGRSAVYDDHNEEPWCPVPLVGVAGKHGPALLDAARRGAEASVVIAGDDRAGVRPRNVNGWIGDGGDLIIVTTPISALTQSGGERGPGVAIFLGLARWLGQRQPTTRYLFSGNTGHEEHGTGAYALIDTVPPPSEVKAWLHLGAGISNRYALYDDGLADDSPEWRQKTLRRSGTPYLACSKELVPLLTEAFSEIPELTPKAIPGAGELAVFLERGYNAFGFYGPNRVFHTWADTADQSSPELLEPVARACARALVAIEEL
jgi:hypothetical protein